jgi:hypothetical protein
VTVKNSDLTNQNLDAVAGSEPTYTLSGTVLTAGGGGIEGVKVTVTGATAGSVFTDAEGQYSVSGLVNGSYAVTPSKTGYTFTPGNISATVNGSDLTGQDFSTSTYLISGTVTSAGGAAMQGVTVALSGPATGSTITDDSGNYSIQVTVNGTYTVTAAATGYSFTPSSISVAVAGADATDRNFTADTYSISGTVMAGGAALPGVTVTLSGTATATATTDANGYYRFPVTLKGVYIVTPAKTGYSFSVTSASATISDNDVTGLDFTAVTYSISGTVTSSEGGALAGVTVSLSGVSTGTATTAADGNYRFTGLLNGNYTLSSSLNGYSFTPSSLSVTVSSADIAGVAFIGTATTCSISGAILKEGTAGQGVPGVTVTLSGAATGSTTTDASGNYSFNGLANGVYTVTPSFEGYSFGPANRTVTISDADVSGNNFMNYPSGSLTFNPTGAVQTWTVPYGIYWVTLTCSGGGGYGGYFIPGAGGTARGTLWVSPGQTFSIYVGQMANGSYCGYNGGLGRGGQPAYIGRAGGGGASSYIRADGQLVIGAGGGGGASLITVYTSDPISMGSGGGGGVGGNGGDPSTLDDIGRNGGAGYDGVAGGSYGDWATLAGSAAAGSGAGGGGGVIGGGDGAGYVSDPLFDSSQTVGGNAGNGQITISW